MTPNHSPLPWREDKRRLYYEDIVDATGRKIATVRLGSHRKRILASVNSHSALVEALKSAKDWIWTHHQHKATSGVLGRIDTALAKAKEM